MSADPRGQGPPDAPPPADRLGRSASLAGAATLTSRVLGLAREQVQAGVFGAGNEMDAYLVALRLPSLVRDLFSEGAMSAAFVPTFTRCLAQRGRDAAWQLGRNVLTALLVTTGAFVAAGLCLAPWLVQWYAPEFADIPGKATLTVTMGRVLLPFLTLTALAAACMGMLNSLRHYFVPSLAPATFNVTSIVCLVGLLPLMSRLGLPPIAVLPIATLTGGVMQLVVQWPALRREGFRFRPYLDLRDPGLRQILLLMGPGTLGIAATQINLFVTTQLATYQGVGAVSWLTYAFRLIYLPVGLFGVSIATAVLPTASRHAANDDGTAIASTVARGLGLMLVVNLPATIGLILLSDDIVRLLYERGRFLPADTTATAMVLRYYAVGLIGYSAARITAPVFYALHRSRVPVILSTVTIALNLVLAPLLVQQLGVRGLALSTSIGALFNATALVVLLARHLGPAPFRPLGSTVLRASLASVAMALAVTASHRALRVWWPGDQLVTQAFTVAATIGVGVGALVLAGLALRIAEMADAVRAVRRRLGM